ncbi:MAG: hypothetical protein ABI346_09095 [Candidatus Baltobacteraceae bacterium]
MRQAIVVAALAAVVTAGSGCSTAFQTIVSSAVFENDAARVRAALASSPPTLGGCAVFPADNPWNANISQAPVDPNSANYLAHMNAGTTFLHPDFGHDPHYGIPITVAPPSTPYVPMKFFLYPDQSDPGPYPFPPGARIEGGPHAHGDRHVLVVYQGNCHLYETYDSHFVGRGWRAGNGAVFDLSSDALRPICWTSADAAGLPIAAGLADFDQVQSGAMDHALRFTVAKTQRAFVSPARHDASSSTDPNDPPMGLRVRLKASFGLSGFHGESLVILQTLKAYGMMLADNGSDWYIGGTTDSRWNDSDLAQLKTVPASAFEVVRLGKIHRNC